MALRLSELTFKTQDSKLSFENTIEFYKTLYSRIVEFTGTTSDFSQLSTSDRKIMLSHNLESICIVRMASNFHPQLSTNLDLEPLKIFFGPCPLKIEQIFNQLRIFVQICHLRELQMKRESQMSGQRMTKANPKNFSLPSPSDPLCEYSSS